MVNDALTNDAIDAANAALDKLEFAYMAFSCDEQTHWNGRADNGLSAVMREALDVLGDLVGRMER